jgi:5'-nucleotidase
MRILLTNDDGIHAPGIKAMYRALSGVAEVWMVAPERPRSAAGHAITLHKPLRIVPTSVADDIQGFACSGTPSDCVSLGVEVVMGGSCDMVISGINAGANLGWDVTYSGTVAAAIEGAILGMPSIAISVTLEGGAEAFDFSPAARFGARLALQLAASPLPANTLLNVNVPALPGTELKGVEVTHQGRREYIDRIDTREDPTGKPYYWLGGSLREDEPDPGSDVHAVIESRISVTPIHLDMTAYRLLEQVSEWELDLQ